MKAMRVMKTVMLVGGGLLLMAEATTALAGAPDRCVQGFVWREAFPGDFVCVTPATRAQAAADNRAAKMRFQRGGGAYGPDTCVQGYVWREANPKDHVCVKPEVRAQAAEDNRMAQSRTMHVNPPQEVVNNRGVATNSQAWRAAQVARPAATQEVACPVNQVRVEIQTSLPSPWWQTPQVGPLADTDVMNIGGKMTLVCRYRAYGAAVAVMREMPPGLTSCSPVTGGFRCQ